MPHLDIVIFQKNYPFNLIRSLTIICFRSFVLWFQIVKIRKI